MKNAPGFRSIPPRWLAALVGVGFSVGLTATGYVDLPQVEGGAELATAAMLGLLAFAAAHGVHKANKAGEAS